jgi:selenocysteine lyase/cysteine desulfurase
VEIVTLDTVVWSEPPDRDEAGSPNTVGAVALAAAITQLQSIGMDTVARHEAELTTYALERLNRINSITIYGDTDPARASSRLGVIPINMDGKKHYEVAAILGYEYGIGVRNGCFCAHPYLLQLMHVEEDSADVLRDRIVHHDKREVPGLVRISFGLYNTTAEIDRLISALQAIADDRFFGKYHQDQASGAYIPEGWQPGFETYFTF